MAKSSRRQGLRFLSEMSYIIGYIERGRYFVWDIGVTRGDGDIYYDRVEAFAKLTKTNKQN